MPNVFCLILEPLEVKILLKDKLYKNLQCLIIHMLLRHYTHSTDPSLICWHKWVCMSVQHKPGGGGILGGGGKGGGGILGGKKGNSFGEDSSVSEDCSDTTWNHTSIWDQYSIFTAIHSVSIKQAKTHLDVIFISAVTSSAFHSTDGPCLSSDNIDRTTRLPAFTPTCINQSQIIMLSPYVWVRRIKCALHTASRTQKILVLFCTIGHLVGTHTIACNLSQCYFPADLGNLLWCARLYF